MTTTQPDKNTRAAAQSGETVRRNEHGGCDDDGYEFSRIANWRVPLHLSGRSQLLARWSPFSFVTPQPPLSLPAMSSNEGTDNNKKGGRSVCSLDSRHSGSVSSSGIA